MAYLLLLTLLCLSLLLVMSSEGVHGKRKTHFDRKSVGRKNVGRRSVGQKGRQNASLQQRCVIIQPLRKRGKGKETTHFITFRDGWTVEMVSCGPTTKEGLSGDCSWKINENIDLLVFDVFNSDELRDLQHNLAIFDVPRIKFFVRSHEVSNQQTGKRSWKEEFLDIGKLLKEEYFEETSGNFVEFSREGRHKVSYYGDINWQINVGTDLKYKEKDNANYTTLHSFVGTIWKNSASLVLYDGREKVDRGTALTFIQISKDTEGTFKPIEDQDTTPINFEHNFTLLKERLQITLKENNILRGD